MSMADPLTVATIVTLVLTKAFEKQGEKISEALWDAGGKLLGRLKAKFPLTGMKLEQVQQNPELMESHQKDFGVEVLEAEIVTASRDEEIAALMEELAVMVRSQNPNLRRMVVLSQVEVEDAIEIGDVEQESQSGEGANMAVAERVKAKSLKIGDVMQKQ
jgi:hypothetical protein